MTPNSDPVMITCYDTEQIDNSNTPGFMHNLQRQTKKYLEDHVEKNVHIPATKIIWIDFQQQR